MSQFIGIDIGGTKISICIGNEKGKIINNDRIQTQPLKGSKAGIQAIITITEKLLKDSRKTIHDINAIGISCPGPISHAKGMMISPPNLKGWENTPIVKEIEKAFEKPTFMNNDANAAVLAEYEFGASKKTKNMIYLTTSTGMGGGIILNGQLIQGISDTAGEVGHFVLNPNGEECPCGQKGCFEVYCGGANVAKKVKNQIREKNINTQILKEAGGQIDEIDMISISNAVFKQDLFALDIWEEFTEKLAQGISILLMTLNPEVIILGTIAVHTGDLLLKPVKEKLQHYAWPMVLESVTIEASQIGDKISELSSLAIASTNFSKA